MVRTILRPLEFWSSADGSKPSGATASTRPVGAEQVEAVALHPLVGIHRVQAGRVKAGQPHVAHNHDLERIFWIFELDRQFPPLLLVADVLLPLGAVLSAAGHDDLSYARIAFLGFAVVVVRARPVEARIDDSPAICLQI